MTASSIELRPEPLAHCDKHVCQMWQVFERVAGSPGRHLGCISTGVGGINIASARTNCAVWVGSFGVGLALLRHING